MSNQRNVLEEILGNIHLKNPSKAVLNELLYTANETGMIENIDIEEVEIISKIFALAIMYTNDGTKVPEELRM